MNTHQNNKESIQKELEELAVAANKKVEDELIRICISSLIDSSPIIDKFSTWLLAGCGATAALMIANMKAIIPFLGTSGFKASIYLLIISTLTGLLQKRKATGVQSFSKLAEKLLSEAKTLDSAHRAAFDELHEMANEQGVALNVKPFVDNQRIKKEFSKMVPLLMRTAALKHFDKGTKDILHGWRQINIGFKWQLIYFAAQFIFFIGFLLLVAISV